MDRSVGAAGIEDDNEANEKLAAVVVDLVRSFVDARLREKPVDGLLASLPRFREKPDPNPEKLVPNIEPELVVGAALPNPLKAVEFEFGLVSVLGAKENSFDPSVELGKSAAKFGVV